MTEETLQRAAVLAAEKKALIGAYEFIHKPGVFVGVFESYQSENDRYRATLRTQEWKDFNQCLKETAEDWIKNRLQSVDHEVARL